MTKRASTLPSVIQQGIQSALKELHTALPGVINKFNAAKQTAEIQLTVRRVFVKRDAQGDKTFTPVDLPPVINVPVVFPHGGGFALTFPVVKGDECLVLFCERSIDNWHKQSGVQTPSARRFHSFSDAVAIVGLNSEPNKVENFSADSIDLRNESGSTKISVRNTQVDVVAADIKLTGSVEITGNVSITGNIESFGTVINNLFNIGSTHIHIQPNDSAGDTQSPVSPPL